MNSGFAGASLLRWRRTTFQHGTVDRMNLKRKKKRPFSSANLLRLTERAQRLDRSDLFEHLDSAVSLVTRYTAEYRRQRHPDLLAETMLSAEAIYALAQELLNRDEPPPHDEEEQFPKLQRARQSMRDY